MARRISMGRPAIWLSVAFFVWASGPANATRLHPGEVACAGASGILIGLGFIMNADGTYTDLDRKTSGRVVDQGSSTKFVGGHLDGYVGTGVSRSSFQIHGIGCSHN